MRGVFRSLACMAVIASPVWGQVAPPLVLPPGAAPTKADAADAQKTPPSLAIKIADEPHSIDMTTLVPSRLAGKATVRFEDKSLRDVVDWLKAQKLELQIDARALAEADIHLNEQVVETLNDEPIVFLLNRLSMLGLGWYEEDGLLHLTSRAAAEHHDLTASYILSDLLDAGYEADDDFIGLLESTIQPASWKSNGGQGTAVVLGDVMFVRQNAAVNRELAGLLAALKTHGRRTYVLDSVSHDRLRAALDAPVTLKLRDATLTAATAELAKAAKCEIRIDRHALAEGNIRERMPVTIDAQNQKLRHALRAMLNELKLTWLLRDGVLWITTPAVADDAHRTAVYDVRDLCRDESESDALTQTITEQAGPTTWKANGGQGDVEFAKPGVMVVVQTEEGHDELLRLLENYRTALRSSKPRKRVERALPIKIYYKVPLDMSAELRKYVTKEIRPDSWSTAEREAVGMITTLPSTPELRNAHGATVTDGTPTDAKQALVIPHVVWVVRQTEDVHAELAELLRNLQHGNAGAFGGYGGGGFGGGAGGMGGGGLGGEGRPRKGGLGFGGGYFSVRGE
ncbi:MAG: hypothetical protein QM811_25540 [Pirellulales bacterium]